MMKIGVKRALALILVIPLMFFTFVPSSQAMGQSKIIEYVDSPLPVYYPPGEVVEEILETRGDVNQFLISFWTLDSGPQGAAFEWMIGTFGDPQEAAARFHEAGAKVLIAAGGANEAPVTSDPEDGFFYGQQVAQFALEYGFDGIDFDIENIPNGQPELTSEWLAAATIAAHLVYPGAIISHAPQAPYFSPVQAYGYLEVNEKVGDLIDSYNIQFYNQEAATYDTYESLFIMSDPFYQPGTAVREIYENGVPLEKIVIGKPITPEDAYNTGYVPPEVLRDFICQGVSDGLAPGGVMGWQWLSDKKEQDLGELPWSMVVSECLW